MAQHTAVIKCQKPAWPASIQRDAQTLIAMNLFLRIKKKIAKHFQRIQKQSSIFSFFLPAGLHFEMQLLNAENKQLAYLASLAKYLANHLNPVNLLVRPQLIQVGPTANLGQFG